MIGFSKDNRINDTDQGGLVCCIWMGQNGVSLGRFGEINE